MSSTIRILVFSSTGIIGILGVLDSCVRPHPPNPLAVSPTRQQGRAVCPRWRVGLTAKRGVGREGMQSTIQETLIGAATHAALRATVRDRLVWTDNPRRPPRYTSPDPPSWPSR